MTTPLIIHLHIPKNAGTTLSRMIKAKLGFWPPRNAMFHSQVLGYYYLNHTKRLAKIQALSPKAARRVRFVEAHAGYGLHTQLPEPSAYLTMLRDPVDRTLSVFGYQKQHKRIAEDLPLEKWIMQDAQHFWHVDNAQVRYLAGDEGQIVDVPHGRVTRDMLTLAKARLEENFLLAGLIERFDESVLLLRRLMNWNSCAYGRSNVTRKRNRVEELPDDTLDLIRSVNQLDIELYAHAQMRLNERIEAAGSSFQDELTQFREYMAVHGERLAKRYKLLGMGRKVRRRVLNQVIRS